MNIIDKLKGKKPPETSKVTLTRNVLVKLPDGSMQGGVTGDSFDVLKADADALVGSGAAERILNPKEQAEAERIGKLIPPPHDPRPLPENFKSLPACFRQWWELSERYRCLKGRQTEIEACVIRGCGLTKEEAHWLRHDVGAVIGEEKQRAKLIQNWQQTHQLRISFSQADMEDQRRLRDALTRQGEAIDEFLKDHHAELAALKIECGSEVEKANGRAIRVSKELARTGFEIFKTRVAALGVSDDLIFQWFGGSADSLKYTHPVSKIEGQRYGWTDHETGERVQYIDRPVEALACLLPRFQAEEQRLSKLLKSAKAELSKAKEAPTQTLALPS